MRLLARDKIDTARADIHVLIVIRTHDHSFGAVEDGVACNVQPLRPVGSDQFKHNEMGEIYSAHGIGDYACKHFIYSLKGGDHLGYEAKTEV
jgi:hypothetical protein